MGKRNVFQLNEAFEKYYRGHVIAEEEWDQFVETVQKPLPITFRFVQSHALCRMACDRFQGVVAPLEGFDNEEWEGEPIGTYRALSWYPNKEAWELDFSKTALRKHALLKVIHNFLKESTLLGTVIRQEAVSMIPVLCLAPEPGHRVLDSCSAPGTKTLQLIDFVGHDSMITANELDGRRCCMLAHISQKARHPGLVITKHDATETLPLPMFDRILCDVPCSGDGTLRKAPPILWSGWKPNRAISFHNLQYLIALNCARHLKPGGRMVYSTCSLNPLENEAVVQALVGTRALRIVDPPLRRGRPGMRAWDVVSGSKIVNNVNEALGSYAEAHEKGLSHLPASLWPSGEDIGLEKTMRMLPHDDNHGGFYVALLERTDEEVPPRNRDLKNFVPHNADDLLEVEEEKPSKMPANLSTLVRDPFVQCITDTSERTTEMLASIRAFYGLTDSFPFDCLFIRNLATGRQVYFVSPPVRDLLVKDQPRAVIAGVRAFEEAKRFRETECTFRITQEGAASIWPHMTKRKLVLEPEVMYSWLKMGSDGVLDVYKADPPIGTYAYDENWPQGSILVSTECNGCQFLAAAEKGARSLRPFVNKDELAEIVRNLEFVFH